MVAHREAKENVPNKSAEMERRILYVVWSDRVTSAEIRQRKNTKNILAVAHSRKRKLGGHEARKGQRRWTQAASMVGKGRSGGTEDPMADTFQTVAEGQQIPGANVVGMHNGLTSNATYCSDVSSKWLHRCI